MLEITWVTPAIFMVSAVVVLLWFQIPIAHPWALSGLSLAFAGLALWYRHHQQRREAIYFPLEFLAVTAIVTGTNGVRSPLVMLFLVFILECATAYGPVAGLLSAVTSLAGLTLASLHEPAFVVLDRLIATSPFFAVVGVLTGALTQATARQQQRLAELAAERELARRELRIARDIQQALLPRATPAVGGWAIEWTWRPHELVGGDLVQFFHPPEGLGCVLADVTGKGISAALLVSSLHQMILRWSALAPHDMLVRINQELCESTPDGISVTLLVIRLDAGGEVVVANAGHPPPMVRRVDGTVETWPQGGLLAGWFPDAPYTLHRAHLHQGDTLLAYTDGLTDTLMADGTRLMDDGVELELGQHGHEALPSLLGAVMDLVGASQQVDDVTVLLLRRDLAAPPPVSSPSQ
ncbi:MAG TPA: SpoIIE family protein phosphatase [Candidatus Xenobia bacterium]|jgi:serine phosphatase RsbU (regulator of sigma subunit)